MTSVYESKKLIEANAAIARAKLAERIIERLKDGPSIVTDFMILRLVGGSIFKFKRYTQNLDATMALAIDYWGKVEYKVAQEEQGDSHIHIDVWKRWGRMLFGFNPSCAVLEELIRHKYVRGLAGRPR